MKFSKVKSAGYSRREFLYASGASLAAMALAGNPQYSFGAEKPKYGGKIRVAYRYGSAGLDAHRNQDFIDYFNYCHLYSGLTQQGPLPQVEIYPMLASSWDISPDGREYIFPLKRGIKFHHGKEMDSSDVKYSYDRVMNPATRSPKAFSFRWVDAVQIIDKYQIKFKLKEPFAPFLSTLTVANCPIIPAGSEPSGPKPAPGTGPFVLKSFVPNESTDFLRFDKYWEVDEKTGDRLPYIDSLHVKKVVDENVRFVGLRAGELEIASSPSLKALLESTKKPVPGVVMHYELVGNGWIWFNMSKAPFNNKKVRQAVAYAVDKKEYNRGVFWGLSEEFNHQPFRKVSRFYIPVEEREVNIAKAKQLLAEAGYPRGFKTEFLMHPVNYDLDGCQIIMAQLRKIGIEATMKVIDRAAWVRAMRSGDYVITNRGDSERYDWDDAYYPFFHSSEIGKNNYSRYSNKEVDALLEKGRLTWKTEERKPIYKKVVEMIREEVPVHYICKTVVGNALRGNVKGYVPGFGIRAFHGGGIKLMWIKD